MILTGQANKDFEKWYSSTESVDIYKSDYSDKVFNTIRNALIIEWFDSVELNIYVIPRFHFGCLVFDVFIDGMEISRIKIEHFKKRQKALETAITKANEIYNTRKSTD